MSEPTANSLTKILFTQTLVLLVAMQLDFGLLNNALHADEVQHQRTNAPGESNMTGHRQVLELNLLPRPQSATPLGGIMSIPRQSKISIHRQLKDWSSHWSAIQPLFLRAGYSIELTTDPQDAVFQVRVDENLADEEYGLRFDERGVTLTAKSLKGFCRATSSLLQLAGCSTDGKCPTMTIGDQPDCSYRSLMIDMGRNPHSLALLKETVDLLWFYKLESLHLHLTDDQRFAFQSKQFPKLWDGLITFEQFQDLDEYARLRGISIIPELEVPGHSTLLTRHYPEVFGQNSTEIATSQQAFDGIKILIDEIAEAFPSSQMFHIGGDEAFGVPEDAQRELINRLHQYLKTKGKETLVWEGPAAGPADNRVHQDVIQINWRTINYPADKMLERNHRVVNAAWDPLYVVDHYPRINFTMTSPQHIYDSLQLNRFKHVNPGIQTYSNPVETQPSHKLIGFCMPWWEGREENFFSMIVPRVIPLAEIAWHPPSKRDFDEFDLRTEKLERARSKSFYPVTIAADRLAIERDGVFHGQTKINFRATEKNDVEIRYTTDGSEPSTKSSLFQAPFLIDKSAVIRAALFSSETKSQIGHGSRRKFTRVEPQANLALGKPVSSSATSGTPFSAERLTDGGIGNLDFYLGYPATDDAPIEVTIDLEKPQSVDRIVIHAYTISNSFEKYGVQTSLDGTEFETVAERTKKPEKATSFQEHSFSARQVRFIKIISFGNRGYVFDSFSKLVEVQAFGPEE